MSNNRNANPLQFTDATLPSLVKYAGPKYLPISTPQGQFRIKKIVWVNPAANGDTYTVTDGNGNTISTGVCVTASVGLPQTNLLDQLTEDLQVTQLSSGTLLIYVEPE